MTTVDPRYREHQEMVQQSEAPSGYRGPVSRPGDLDEARYSVAFWEGFRRGLIDGAIAAVAVAAAVVAAAVFVWMTGAKP